MPQYWQKFIIEDGVYPDAVRAARPIGLSVSEKNSGVGRWRVALTLM